jgi:hypothetical protein
MSNNKANSQYPIFVRQINNRLNKSLNPALPSSIAVIRIPASDDQRTEVKTNSAGSFIHLPKLMIPAPIAHASIKNAVIGYLRTRLGFDALPAAILVFLLTQMNS